jgi:hypothetical protein
MSLARQIVERSIDHLVSALGLEEIRHEQGIFKVLRSETMPDFNGKLRVFRGTGSVERMVSTSLVMPARDHQTHMLFCFGAADTLLPHFTIDSSDQGQGLFAFHLDLIPRLELGAHLTHMRAVYGPLTDTFLLARSIAGLTPVNITPEQRSVMSPWMLVHGANEAAFARCEQEIMTPYREHFVELCKRLPAGPKPSLDRDRAVRAALFDPSVDPVWGRVDRMLGVDTTALIRGLLDGTREL